MPLLHKHSYHITYISIMDLESAKSFITRFYNSIDAYRKHHNRFKSLDETIKIVNKSDYTLLQVNQSNVPNDRSVTDAKSIIEAQVAQAYHDTESLKIKHVNLWYHLNQLEHIKSLATVVFGKSFDTKWPFQVTGIETQPCATVKTLCYKPTNMHQYASRLSCLFPRITTLIYSIDLTTSEPFECRKMFPRLTMVVIMLWRIDDTSTPSLPFVERLMKHLQHINSKRVAIVVLAKLGTLVCDVIVEGLRNSPNVEHVMVHFINDRSRVLIHSNAETTHPLNLILANCHVYTLLDDPTHASCNHVVKSLYLGHNCSMGNAKFGLDNTTKLRTEHDISLYQWLQECYDRAPNKQRPKRDRMINDLGWSTKSFGYYMLECKPDALTNINLTATPMRNDGNLRQGLGAIDNASSRSSTSTNSRQDANTTRDSDDDEDGNLITCSSDDCNCQ